MLGGAAFLSLPAPADAPINLAASRPAPAPKGTRVAIPPTTVQPSETTREVSPSGKVTYWFHDHGPLIAVCTTFPGKVNLDRAGNVYKQPVSIDAQGHQRAVGAPVLLTSPKQVGGVTTTTRP